MGSKLFKRFKVDPSKSAIGQKFTYETDKPLVCVVCGAPAKNVFSYWDGKEMHPEPESATCDEHKDYVKGIK